MQNCRSIGKRKDCEGSEPMLLLKIYVILVDLKLHVTVQPQLSKDFTEHLPITSTSFVRLCACMCKRYILLVLIFQINTCSLFIK